MGEGERPDAAEQVAKQMHTAIQSQNWDTVMPLYGDKFFAKNTRQGWHDKLASLHERFGDLRKVKPVFAQREPRLGGDYFVHGFKLMFERGVVEETLTLYQKSGEQTMTVTGQIFKFKDDVL